MNESQSFRDGFIEGWKAIMGSTAGVPMIPLAPMIPLGKTAYQVGLQKGMEAGQKRKGK